MTLNFFHIPFEMKQVSHKCRQRKINICAEVDYNGNNHIKERYSKDLIAVLSFNKGNIEPSQTDYPPRRRRVSEPQVRIKSVQMKVVPIKSIQGPHNWDVNSAHVTVSHPN